MMHVAEEIAEEIYQVYASGKCGIVLEMQHRQEWELITEILRTKYFVGKVGLEVCSTLKERDGKMEFAPAVYQKLSTKRKLPDSNYALENVQPGSYLAAVFEKFTVGKGIGYIFVENYHLLGREEKTKSSVELQQILRMENTEEKALIMLAVDQLEHLPQELLPYIHTICGKKPGITEIREKTEQVLERKKLKLGGNFKREIVSYLQGFRDYEIDYLFRRAEMAYGEDAFDENKKMVLDLIGNEKVKLLEKGRLLEWKMVKHVDMANMENLEKYLKESGTIMGQLEEAIVQGVDVPKGILIVGLPGTGKSLFAQYAAAVLKVPLIRLEMGRMMGGHVGDSERNLREARMQAEEMAPCILWIDEIEKGFAGTGDNGREEGAYLKRMTGDFLTWLQEKQSSCYIIATANSIDGLPPEFFRKGRFDECFFTTMPSERELRGILRVHLSKPGRIHTEPEAGKAIDDVIRHAMAGKRFMTGADAYALVSNTFRRLYLDYHFQDEIKDKKEYDRRNLASVMVREFKDMKVFSETNGKDIVKYDEEIRRLNFKPASAAASAQDGVSYYGYDKNLEAFIIREKEKYK